jgi:hypothetical protein
MEHMGLCKEHEGRPKVFLFRSSASVREITASENPAKRADLPPGVEKEEVERVRGLKLCKLAFLRGECGLFEKTIITGR